jgi:hypothetical protein
MDTEQKVSEPFFELFYKCDDQFKPSPPDEFMELVKKLIRKNLPHTVNQSRTPSIEEVRAKNGLVFIKDLDGVFDVIPTNVYGEEFSEAICIQSYDEKLMNPYKEILKWLWLYDL